MFKRRLSPFLLVAFAGCYGLLGVPEASATVPTRLGLVTYEPVPANGVLTFSVAEGMTVRILSADGEEVPGRFIEANIWRPDEPFALGTYTADVEFEPSPSRAEDRTFEVIAAVTELPDVVDVLVSSHVEVTEALEETCCLAGSANVNGQACVTDCKPLCVPTVYGVKHIVRVIYDVDWDHPLESQFRVTAPPTLLDGEFVEGSGEVTDTEPELEQLCGVAQLFSWLDESTTVVRKCIPNPKPDVSPIRDAVRYFGQIKECTTPPEGHQAAWCEAQTYTCEVELLTLPEAERPAMLEACDVYYELCEREAPTTDDDNAADETAGATGESQTDEGELDDVVRREVDDTSGACACRVPPGARTSSRNTTPLNGVFGLLLGVSAVMLRRQRG